MRTIARSSIVVSVFVIAATVDAQPPRSQAPATSRASAVEPGAIAALERMGTFLRDQRSFTVRMTTETDYVLDTGQKVSFSAQGDLRVRRPDHLRADVISDRKDRQFFYDGKTFTMYGRRVGFYATVAAPPTIAELADMLEQRYAMQFPLVDLFRIGSDEDSLRRITDATVIGPEKLGSVETDHYAFRQPGLDWQIWIERGSRPLPRKLVLTTTDDAARPEHSIELTWELNARHPDAIFTFVPPKDSSRIALAELITPHAQKDQPARRSVRR